MIRAKNKQIIHIFENKNFDYYKLLEFSLKIMYFVELQI